MTDCVCGHSRASHDYRDGCIKFLCCNRTRNLFPGKRHSEHDFVDHQVKHCLCKAFVAATRSRWDEDTEAGAIG